MANLNEFVELLNRLQNPDNEIRTQAENTYDGIEPSLALSLLMQSMDNKAMGIEIRLFAAVLCRRLLNSKFEAYTNLAEDAKSAFRNQLLLCMHQEAEEEMRKKICDVACQLLNDLSSDEKTAAQEWPDMLKFMLDCTQSDNVTLLTLSFYILRRCPNIFGEHVAASIDHLVKMFTRGLSEQTPKVLEYALTAIAAFLEASPEDEVVQALKPIVPSFLHAISIFVQHVPENEEPLKALVQVADVTPKFLRSHLRETLEICYQILLNENLNDSIRQLALEVIVTLAENTPASVRKVASDMIEPMVEFLLKMMCEIEDDPDWENEENAEEEDEVTNAVTAELALDRLACALGGKNILSPITSKVPAMLASDNWKSRQAGLMAVSACGEGCMKQMEQILPAILEAILPKLGDPHPRVRHAACNAIGQMAMDFSTKIQKAHHSTILPALMHVFDDPCARVQSIAGAAVVNFCEKINKVILRQYLPPLIAKLEAVMAAKFNELQTARGRMVLEQIVTTVASVADSAEEDFEPYYDQFMPRLTYIMRQATHPDYKMLRGKTIECISLIGLAVGKERFMHDAAPIMELLLSAQRQSSSENNNVDSSDQGTIMEPDDPQICFMIGAWARICKILGPDFQPYLPLVMPQVLATASIKPDVCLVDNDQAEQVDEDDNWQVVKLNENQNFAIRTSGLDDKSTACRMLLCYARELKQAFAPYCDRVLEIMLPTLKFYFYDEVRSASAEIMPFLLDVIKLNNANNVPPAWNRICKGLLEAISNEPERELLADQLEALAGCVEVLGSMACNEDGTPALLTSQQLTEMLRLMDRLFHEHFEKAEERMAKRRDEDYDEQEEERLMSEKDDDEYVLCKMYDLMHALFVTQKIHAIDFFKSLMVHCHGLLKPGRPWSDLQWGICFWGDVVEYGGHFAWELRDYYLPTLAQCLTHKENEVRQNSVSTIGLMAIHGGPEFMPSMMEMVPLIIAMIEKPDSRNEDNNCCTENAIAALTKMMKYKPEVLQPQTLGCSIEAFLAKWVSWLPIYEDDMETECVYKQLCDLVESNNPHVLGPDNCNVPHIVSAITICINSEGITPKTGLEDSFGNPIAPKNPGEASVWERCINLLRQIQMNLPAVFEMCVNGMSEYQQKSLGNALGAATGAGR